MGSGTGWGPLEAPSGVRVCQGGKNVPLADLAWPLPAVLTVGWRQGLATTPGPSRLVPNRVARVRVASHRGQRGLVVHHPAGIGPRHDGCGDGARLGAVRRSNRVGRLHHGAM